jgi:hypothetical protein
MSISTYTELQTAVANWMNRTDLTTRIPEFIAMGENGLNRKLRLLQQEDLWTATYDTSNTTGKVALPSGFVEMLTLSVKKSSETDRDYEALIYKSPEDLILFYNTSASRPDYYTLRNELELNRLAGAAYTLRMHYLKKWDIAGDATNWLLTNHEDAYLFASLVAAEPYVKNDERVALWKAQLKEVVADLNLVDGRSRNRTEMTLDPRARSIGAYNILNDRQ